MLGRAKFSPSLPLSFFSSVIELLLLLIPSSSRSRIGSNSSSIRNFEATRRETRNRYLIVYNNNAQSR